MRRIKDYVLQEEVGRGAYSTVYKCICLTDQNTNKDAAKQRKLYACKLFTRSKMNQRMLKNLHEETVSIRKLCHHPNIIRQFASYKTKRHFYLIVEYCNAGDLETLLEQGLYMSERHVRFVYREVLKGMKSMNELGILHRDIKNANILLHMPKINPSQSGGLLQGNG